MKKGIAIFLLSLLVFQAGGFLIFFGISQLRIRNEIIARIKAGVPESELVVFRIDNEKQNDFQKLFSFFKSGEFNYKGKMYDVVRVEKIKNETVYFTLSDEKETFLFHQLDQILDESTRESPLKETQSSNFQILINSLFFQKDKNSSVGLSLLGELQIPYHFSAKTWVHLPAVPPPRI